VGIESDHLVYEYLSRVGDLAQRRQLPSADRMRLVAGLRDEIDRRRAKYEPDTPAAVRRILDRLGTPEQVLDDRAAGTPAPPAPPATIPLQRGPAAPPSPEPVNTPPHLAGLDELGDEPDWWRVTPGPYGSGPQVEGFAGGVELPELLDPAPEKEAPPEPKPPSARAALAFLRARRKAKSAPEATPDKPAPPTPRPKPHPFLLLAAAVLLIGIVTGYWVLLAAGWLLAYASRVLGPTERKWAVFGLPGLVAAAAMVWLWGRLNGRWGEALADDQLSGAVHGLWPWLARAAALASAAYLTWRAYRHR
jgi:hypothetical protein